MPAELQRPELPVLAVVGAPSVGKKAVLSRVIGVPCEAATSSNTVIWNIDTRYYTADVSCLIAEPHQAARADEYEAVILVFAADQQPSFLACKQWAVQADLSRAELKLCISNKSDRLSVSEDSLQRPPWLEDCKEWCCQEFFEFIEVSAENLELDGQLADRDGEQQGIRRVVSALQAHTWPGLRLHQRQLQSSNTPQPVDGQEAQQTAQAAQPTEPTEPSSNGAAVSHQVNGALPNGFGGVHLPDGASASLRQDVPADTQAATVASASGHAAAEGSNAGEPRDENEMDHFERVLSQAAEARASLQGLPDEQRREAAARMALQFAQLMGMDESDDDSLHDVVA